MPSQKQAKKKRQELRRVDRDMFEDVRLKLEGSGLPDELQNMVNPKRTGAPRQLPMSVLLAAVILVFRAAGTATLADTHRLLVTGLDRDFQVELGIRDEAEGAHDEGGALTYRQVQYLFRQIVLRADPKQTDELIERSRRKNFLTRLQTVYARIMIPDGTSKNVPMRAADSTPVFAWHHESSGYDPDATFGYRTKTRSDRRSRFYGYKALTYCQATERPYVEGFSVRPANEGEGPANTDLATALAGMLAAEGLKIGPVAVDLGFSGLRPENFHEPMRRLGAEPVMDYTNQDRGVVMLLGALVTDGRPSCPCLPTDLHRPKRPPRVALGKEPPATAPQRKKDRYARDRKALDDALAAIERRRDYLAGHVKGKGYGDGDVWRCPALEGKVRCTRRGDSLDLPDDRPLFEPGDDVEFGAFCQNDSIELPADAQPKLRQVHTWMDEKWRAKYRLRTHAEGAFGDLKNQRTEKIGRGWIRVSGLVALTIMLWGAICHRNLRVSRRGDENDGKDYGYRDMPRRQPG